MDLCRLRLRVNPKYMNTPFLRPDLIKDAANCCGFTGTIWSQKTENLTLPYLQIHTVQSLE